MRVIAGQFRSRPLRSLRGLAMRPTTDRLRETLFNILGASVEGSVFVDCCAGTGAVGIEALSRGASEVIFVENHRPAANLIRRNLQSLDVPIVGARPIRPPRPPAGARVVAMDEASGQPAAYVKPPAEILALDVVKAVQLLERRHLLADFIFLDPPYDAREQYTRSLEALSSGRLLAPAGRLIVESEHDLPTRVGALESARIILNGDTRVTFYHLARAA